MGRLKKGLLLLCGALTLVNSVCHENKASEKCMEVYNEGGGAAAVLQSLQCSVWISSIRSSSSSSEAQTADCDFATMKGRRRYQEDRILCNLVLRISVFGNNVLREVKVGVVAIFDGHGGNEASEMASKLFFDYFYIHALFGSYKNTNSNTKEILKRALLNTLGEIDRTFSIEAYKNRVHSGTTSVVTLLLDDELLVAHIGDSKALICSGNSTSSLSVTELTWDHNPYREDEKSRIEKAGGYVTNWDVPRVMGSLAITRAIGDVPLKMYGVIAEPEVSNWEGLRQIDSYMVVSSDGIFETLKTQEVCDLLSDEKKPCVSSSSLANCVISNAFAKGSTDNLSVVVIPLKSHILTEEEDDDSL